MRSTIVLTGPPLPGRWSLARALERRCSARRVSLGAERAPSGEIARALVGAERLVVDGDLATNEERRALLGRLPGGARLLAEWHCGRVEAAREVFHRYASRPKLIALAEFRRYLHDAVRREPVDASLGVAVVRVGAALPLDEQVARVVAALGVPLPPPRPAPAARRVLVVEDDDEERALVAEVLTELGFAVELAPDAGVALALLDEGLEVELLISDQRMPGMSGVELTRRLAERHPRVRTVLLTAYSDEETVRDAMRARTVTILCKPLRVIDLERVLQEI
jgi:CheY-like chemotaxis protein